MSQDLSLAIIVNPSLPLGLLANTIGAISIGLGASQTMLAGDRLTDAQGRTVEISANRPVPVLQADAIAIRALLLKALAQSGERAIVPFPAYARALHAYIQYETVFPNRDLAEETIDGLGLAGPSKWIKSLTGSLKLLR